MSGEATIKPDAEPTDTSWWRRLSVRGRALLFGLVLTVVFVVLGAVVPIPYVALGPGSTINTLGSYDCGNGAGEQPILEFTGEDVPAAAAETPGSGEQLNMTTISVTDGMTLFGALGLWLTGNYTLVPREEQFPPDKTVEQVQQENAKQFSDSQSASEVAALRWLNTNDPTLKGQFPEVTYVGSIPEGSPSVDVLDPNDRIIAVDGTEVTTLDTLRAALSTTLPGQVATVTVIRKGDGASEQQLDEKVTLTANAEVGSNGFLGISAVQRPLAPFAVRNTLDECRIGGPSAGLMFTLGIIDRLTAGDLTGSNFVAGTGTIDGAGTVGAIGGVVLKEITVSDAGARYMFVPADNCAEALTRVPAGLTLVKVATLDEAVAQLQAIRDGGPTTGC